MGKFKTRVNQKKFLEANGVFYTNGGHVYMAGSVTVHCLKNNARVANIGRKLGLYLEPFEEHDYLDFLSICTEEDKYDLDMILLSGKRFFHTYSEARKYLEDNKLWKV